MADSSLLGPPRTTSPPRMARDALTGCPAFGWGLRPIIQARRRNTRHKMRQGAIHSRGSRSSLATIRFPRVVDQGRAWGIQKLADSHLPPLPIHSI